MANINLSISKLITALNTKGFDLLYNKKQFMGKEGQPHNLYVLSKAVWDSEKGKYGSKDIYKTTSTIRMCLFLRDMWFTANGQELPMDNEMWNDIREKIRLEEE